MTATITLELPEDVLVAALRKLPSWQRREILREFQGDLGPAIRTVPASELDKWTDLLAVGGDAQEESEDLFND